MEGLNTLGRGLSMPKDRYDLICDTLSRWDSMTPAERRVLCQGKHNY
jgi:hypothetical protein